MLLPDTWKFADPAMARPAFEAFGLTLLRLNDRFYFECVNIAECCQHPIGSKCARHTHRVGEIDWTLKDGIWKCPKLTEDNLCGIYGVRPLACRLFPIGAVLAMKTKQIILYRFSFPTQCMQCMKGRRWDIEEWLVANGFEDMVKDAIENAGEVSQLWL